MEQEERMNYTHEEIISALTVIRAICKEHDECEECPFYNNDYPNTLCHFRNHTPAKWEFVPEDPVWRAFR